MLVSPSVKGDLSADAGKLFKNNVAYRFRVLVASHQPFQIS
jgi:hypothetical protein